MRSSQLLLVPVALLAGRTYAWGAMAHRTVAVIADNYLSATANTWINGILGVDIDTIASWADSYRYTTAGAFSASLHYIDAEDSPPDSCHVTYPADCGDTSCIVAAIANYTTRVQKTSLSKTERQNALKFLVHFLGDITQPLHVDSLDGTGGNTIDVTYDGDDTNLHAVWDTSIPESIAGGSTDADSNAWAKTLISSIRSDSFASSPDDWISCVDITTAEDCALSWAEDANKLVCSVVVPDGVDAVEGDDLSGTYTDSAADTVSMQVAKGGYRLAAWLNALAEAA